MQVDLGPRQQRFVLAVLAMEINRIVTVDRLVDLCWPQRPPASHTACTVATRSALVSASIPTRPPRPGSSTIASTTVRTPRHSRRRITAWSESDQSDLFASDRRSM
jgi:hypothetical protein